MMVSRGPTATHALTTAHSRAAHGRTRSSNAANRRSNGANRRSNGDFRRHNAADRRPNGNSPGEIEPHRTALRLRPRVDDPRRGEILICKADTAEHSDVITTRSPLATARDDIAEASNDLQIPAPRAGECTHAARQLGIITHEPRPLED